MPYNKEHYEKTKESKIKKAKEYYLKNRDKILQRSKEKRDNEKNKS